MFGLLGPNGAGKTSTIEILEGIRARSGGDALVLGLDPTSQSAALKDRIGVCLQDTNLPDNIRVGEAMRLFSRLYSKSHADPDQLLARVDLADKKNAFYRTLSGGQKQRLAIALALINAPSLVFFDEPTTGLDPQVRREIHTLIGRVARGELHGAVDHPLHRGGRTPLRPGRYHGPRADRRAGHARAKSRRTPWARRSSRRG